MFKRDYYVKMRLIIFTSLLLLPFSQCQFFQGNDLEHKDVQRTAAEEELLPSHLKNPFYQNPNIRAALAESSWFGPGERPVQSREAHRIPRREIFSVLNHAGLLPVKF